MGLLENKYLNYYKKYIGEPRELIVPNINRDIPINKNFYYPIIITKIYNKSVVSISPKLYDKFIIFMNKKENLDLIETVREISIKEIKNVEFQFMYRYIKDSSNNIDINSVNNKLFEIKEPFINTSQKLLDRKYKEEQWEKLVNNVYYLNCILKDDKVASLGYVSDIFYGFGNIVIQTIDEHRNCGYGKKVVEAISRECLNNQIIPIYWVNKNNEFSIKLAESLDFKKVSEEFVVKVKNNN